MSDEKDLEASAASPVDAGDQRIIAKAFRALTEKWKAEPYDYEPNGEARPVDGEREPSVENAIAHLRGLNIDQEPVNFLIAEVRRLRALFGGFQLECCEDWTCAQDHARKAGETIHELRAQLAANTIPAAVENLHKHRVRIRDLEAERDRLREQYRNTVSTLRVALADAEARLK